MSIVSSLNIARDSLAVNQAAITVVSNNIANVDTEGYSKQRVDLASVVSVSGRAGNSAMVAAESLSGVALQSVTRYSDAFMQSQYWEQNSTVNYYNKYSTIASGVEDLMNELNDTGLADSLDKFYSAVDALSKDPSDLTARTNYASAVGNLCSVFNKASSNLSNIQESLVGTASDISSSEIATDVDQVNSLLDQITEVNKSIISTNSDGTSAASLLDQRDSLVTKLTSLVNVETKENDNGTINISIGGYDLINGPRAVGELSAANSLDAGGNLVTTVSIVDPKDTSKTIVTGINSSITGGNIAAILDACGTSTSKLTIKGVMDDLNSMASSFATVMNNIQMVADANGTPYCMTNSGSALSNAPTVALLLNNSTGLTTGITAANISLNSAVSSDPYLIAASRMTTFDSTAIGNNANMKEVTESRTDSSYYAGTAIAGSTLEGYMASSVSDIGIKTKSVQDSYTTENKVLTTVETKLKSSIGVNLDEELTDLIKYQRAYQASARVFNVCNQLLDSLVNLGS